MGLLERPGVACLVRPVVAGAMGYPMALMFSFLFPSHDINAMPGLSGEASTMRKVAHSWKLVLSLADYQLLWDIDNSCIDAIHSFIKRPVLSPHSLELHSGERSDPASF